MSPLFLTNRNYMPIKRCHKLFLNQKKKQKNFSSFVYIHFTRSDEGDSSSTSTDDEGKDRLSDLEGPCCQPLKVPPSSPVNEDKPKKKKVSTKTQKLFCSNNRLSAYSALNKLSQLCIDSPVKCVNNHLVLNYFKCFLKVKINLC